MNVQEEFERYVVVYGVLTEEDFMHKTRLADYEYQYENGLEKYSYNSLFWNSVSAGRCDPGNDWKLRSTTKTEEEFFDYVFVVTSRTKAKVLANKVKRAAIETDIYFMDSLLVPNGKLLIKVRSPLTEQEVQSRINTVIENAKLARI